jgi:aminoglycoside 6-adenylyltransferase
MHDWVSEDIWKALHGTFGHFDAEDSWCALFALITLFCSIAQETATHFDYHYPETLITEVVDYVGMLRSGKL